VAVEWLKNTFPRLATESAGRFEGLSESTIRSWFDREHRLLPRFQELLDQGKQAAPRGGGPDQVLHSYPQVEEEIKSILSRMRNEAGAVVNILVIRCVMQAVMERKAPEILEEFKLSSSFVSRWAQQQMK
jgi:hypothetical protein